MKMSISEKIKVINNKIKQNETQYDLDRQTAKISALSSGNVSKYEFLTGKDVLPEKELLEKAARMKKKIEYSPLGKELKAETDIAKEQYQGISFFKSKSNLTYSSKYSFYKYYRNSKKFDNFSFESKYSFIDKFFKHVNKFNKLRTQKQKTKKKKKECAWYSFRIIEWVSRNIFW